MFGALLTIPCQCSGFHPTPGKVDGKVNIEVERFFAETLGLSRLQVSVTKGLSSRNKVVLLEGVGSEEVARTLKGWIG